MIIFHTPGAIQCKYVRGNVLNYDQMHAVVNGDMIPPKHGVAPVRARARSKPKERRKTMLLSYFRWFSPRAVPLWRCRSESLFVYFIQLYDMYKTDQHVIVAKG